MSDSFTKGMINKPQETKSNANTMKKRLMLVSEAMGGGVFTYLVSLANQLADRYEIMLAYAVRPQTPEDFQDYYDPRIQLKEIKNFKRSINPFEDFKAMFELKKAAKEFQPDIIHLHSSKAGVIGRVAFNCRKVPVYYTPHAYSFLMDNYSTWKKAVFHFAEWLCARTNCTTISCSYGEHLETLKLTKRATYVNNGIDIAELNEILGPAGQCRYPDKVYTVGRICHQKGPVLFNQIAAAFPEAEFIWVGDGEQRSLLTSPNIFVTGWKDRETTLKEAEKYGIFLLTSRWEGMPVSLLEAMARKKLCIVSDVIGCNDLIQNEKNGFVCADLDSFIHAVRRGLDSNHDTLKEQASKDIQEKYRIQYMADAYDRIYSGKT